ncbi:hypothetical protein ACFLV5_03070 [Chloroflexota bacterium]
MRRFSMLAVTIILLTLVFALPLPASAQEPDINPNTGLPSVTEPPPSGLDVVNQAAGGCNILWDTYHGVDYGYSPSNRFSSLKSLLEAKGCTVDENSSGILSLDLSQYDVIVVCEGSAKFSQYSTAEVAAIQGFCNSGGGLLIMGDNAGCQNGNINPVSQAFGTTLGLSSVSPDDLYISNLAPHVIFAGVSQIYMRAAGEISGSAPSVEVAWDDSHAMVTIAKAECYRFVALGDINIMDNDYISYSDNQLFSENVFDWLCGARCAPLVGGEAYPIDKVGLLAPWLALAVVILAGGVYLIRRRALVSK